MPYNSISCFSKNYCLATLRILIYKTVTDSRSFNRSLYIFFEDAVYSHLVTKNQIIFTVKLNDNIHTKKRTLNKWNRCEKNTKMYKFMSSRAIFCSVASLKYKAFKRARLKRSRVKMVNTIVRYLLFLPKKSISSSCPLIMQERFCCVGRLIHRGSPQHFHGSTRDLPTVKWKSMARAFRKQQQMARLQFSFVLITEYCMDYITTIGFRNQLLLPQIIKMRCSHILYKDI